MSETRELLSGESWGHTVERVTADHGLRFDDKPARFIVKTFNDTESFFRELRAYRWLHPEKVCTSNHMRREITFYDTGATAGLPLRSHVREITELGVTLRRYHVAWGASHGDVCASNTVIEPGGFMRFIDWEDYGLLNEAQDLAVAFVNIGCGVAPGMARYVCRGYGENPSAQDVHDALRRGIQWCEQYRPEHVGWYADRFRDVMNEVEALHE